MVGGSFFMRNLTRLKFAIEQIFPKFGDSVNRDLDVKKMNQMQIKGSIEQQNSQEDLTTNKTE